MKVTVFISLLLFAFTSSSLTFGEYIAGEYYYCEDESGGSMNGVFGFQQRNGTIDSPNVYDPNQPSREYIYFLYASYPIPIGYASIISESEKEIFLEGRHFSSYSRSQKTEFFVVIINKEDMSMKGTSLNYKAETYSFESKCSLNIDEIRR